MIARLYPYLELFYHQSHNFSTGIRLFLLHIYCYRHIRKMLYPTINTGKRW